MGFKEWGREQLACSTGHMTIMSHQLSFCSYKFESWWHVNWPVSTEMKKWVRATDIQGRSQTSYIAQCNGIVSHEPQIGAIWVFADHTRKNKCVQDLGAPCGVSTHVYLHAQTAVDAADIHTWQTTVILIAAPKYPQFEPHAEDQNGTGSGISLVYLWWGLNPQKCYQTMCW